MKVIVAKTAGFCFGVKRAVNLAFDTKADQPTYTFGPIIHNDSVIRRLGEKGITAIDTLDNQVIDTVIIRAHGVPEVVYKEAKAKAIKIVDATCPYVSKIHKLVNSYAEKGYGIIVIGDQNHPEIIGIDGWAQNASIIIKNKEGIDRNLLDFEKKYLVVSQTTYKKVVVDEVVECLEAGGYAIEYISTICSATKERQDEAATISKEVEGMVVIGSPTSSNTQKLYEICKANCPNTWCVNDESELQLELFKGMVQVGVTAGASTPDDLIDQVVNRLSQL